MEMIEIIFCTRVSMMRGLEGGSHYNKRHSTEHYGRVQERSTSGGIVRRRRCRRHAEEEKTKSCES